MTTRTGWPSLVLGVFGSMVSLVSVAFFLLQTPALRDEPRLENIVGVLAVLYLIVGGLPAVLGFGGAWRASKIGKGGVMVAFAAAIPVLYAAVPVYNQAYGWALLLAAPAPFYVTAWIGRPRRRKTGVYA